MRPTQKPGPNKPGRTARCSEWPSRTANTTRIVREQISGGGRATIQAFPEFKPLSAPGRSALTSDQRRTIDRPPYRLPTGPARRKKPLPHQRPDEVLDPPIKHFNARTLPKGHGYRPIPLTPRRDQQADVSIPVVVSPRDDTIPHRLQSLGGLALIRIGMMERNAFLPHEVKQWVAALRVRKKEMPQQDGIPVTVNQLLVVRWKLRTNPLFDAAPRIRSRWTETLLWSKQRNIVRHHSDHLSYFSDEQIGTPATALLMT